MKFLKRKQKRRFLRLFLEVLSDLLSVTLTLLIILCFWMAYQEKQTGELQFLFGYKAVCIMSGSMEESIQTGAIVLIEQMEEKRATLGDVLMFETADGFVTHRFIGVDKEAKEEGEEAWMITKGDANRIEDPVRIAPEEVRGRVVAVCNAAARLPILKVLS